MDMRVKNRLSSFSNNHRFGERRDESSTEAIINDLRFQELVERILGIEQGSWDGKSLSLTVNGLARWVSDTGLAQG